MFPSTLSLFVTLSACLGLLVWIYRGKQRLASKVELLESILPICMHCKNIRVEHPREPDTWVSVEKFFTEKEPVTFSHGICEECRDKYYPEIKRRSHP